jgi:hypothetical protein
MPSDVDANLKPLSATNLNTFSSIDDVKLDGSFDVNQSVTRHGPSR